MIDRLGQYPGLVLVACAVVFMAVGWSQDGLNLDSTTYAVIARNMADHGSWFTPQYTQWYHPQFAEHPPLVMWLQGLVFWLFGASDPTARIVGQLCVIGSVWLVFLIGRRIRDDRFGFLCGLALLLTYNFGQIGNSTLLDVPMTCFGLLALYGTVRVLSGEKSASAFTVTGLGLAGAFLAKGVVAAPFWVAVLVALAVARRDAFRKPAIWWLPIATMIPIDLFFMADQFFAGGRFIDHYFTSQVMSRFADDGPQVSTAWWEFTWRVVKLAIPFSLLLPLGLFYAVKNRRWLLLPVVVALATYWVLYSSSAKLYYHYFAPVYPLIAILAAFALVQWVSERVVRAMYVVFPALWLLFAVGVNLSGTRVHEIRSAEIYTLSQPMQSLLEITPSRNGVMIGNAEPDWDWVAKAAWYWKSDLRLVDNIDVADSLMKTEHSASYLLAPEGLLVADYDLARLQMRVFTGNEKLEIYVHEMTRSPGELSQR